MDEPSQNDTVRDSFAKQVPFFTGAGSVFARSAPDLSRWGPVEPQWIVLDVACGAGHVAEQFAPHVRQVVGIDLTPALLDVGSRRLEAAGVPNVLLQEADVAELPFVDGSFDLVVCRSSLHHFADVGRSVREMARVCRTGGRVAIDELVQPPAADAATRARYDSLHRLLDPSHLHALTEDELLEVVAAAVDIEEHGLGDPSVLPLDVILSDVSDRRAVLETLEAELDGAAATGFEPSRVDGAIHVAFRSAKVHARKLAR